VANRDHAAVGGRWTMEVAWMSLARTVMTFVLLAGGGIALATWGPVEDLGYAGASIGLLGGALVGAALALLMSELGWRRERHSR
jgi:hypothetical protein